VKGYQITFFTQQDRRHRGKPLAKWLVQLASELGLRGATLIPASEGIGHDHHHHSAHFFELADQPLLVVMAVTSGEADRLFERLHAEGVQLFYVKTAVEFGILEDHNGNGKKV
jgi:PII-like signaling protein